MALQNDDGCLSLCRLLFPDHSEAEQHSLATDLLERSGVSYWKRAQDLTVEEFGAVAHNYQRFMSLEPSKQIPNTMDRKVVNNNGHTHSLV